MEKSDVLDKVFSIRLFSGVPEQDVMCSVASYSCNGTLAFQLYASPERFTGVSNGSDPQRQFCEPFGIATVNLPESGLLPYNVQFIDENNLPGIGAWLQKNNIASPTGYHCPSGYCLYEAYAFNLTSKDLKEVIDRRQDLGTTPVGESTRNTIKIK